MNKRVTPALLLLAFSIPTTAAGQEIPELSGPFGNIVDPVIENFDLSYPEDVGPPFALLSVTPALTYADGVDIYGATIGAGFGPNNNKFALETRFLNISPESGSSLNQWRFRAKYSLNTGIDGFGTTVVATYQTLEDIYDQIGITAAMSYKASDTVTLVANLGWDDRDFDSGGGESDLTAGLGARISVSSAVRIAIDYTVENDITDDEDYSISAAINKRLIVGAAKDDVYFIAYSFPFGVGSQN